MTMNNASLRSVSRLRPDRGWIIVLWLLFAQFTLLAHAVEHELEDAGQAQHAACVLCHAADQLGHGLAPAVLFAVILPTVALFSTPYRLPLILSHFLAFYSRGPPAVALTESPR